MTVRRVRFVAQVGSGSRGISPAFVFSVGMHVVIIAAFVFLPGLRPKRPLPEDFQIVSIVGGIPEAPVRASAPAPVVQQPEPEPEPEPPPPEPQADLRVATELPEPVPDKPEKKPEPKPAPTPVQPTPDSTAAGPAPDAGAAAADAGVGAASGPSIAALDLDETEFAWYRDRVTAALRANWRQPILEGYRESLAVIVRFDILRDGQVSNLLIDVSSGVPSLDRSAIRAVSEAAPFPALPAGMREARLPARFRFNWSP